MSNNNYEKYNCPVCYGKFFDDDDVVVCPDCGAPHHRECFNSLGHCKFENEHGTDKQWNANNNEHTDNDNSGNTLHCPYCNKEIFSDTIFCPQCGNDVNKESGKSNYNNTYTNQNATGFGQFMMYDPLGGISPEEDLGGATAIDCASYIKASTASIIPKFSKMNRNKKKISWNWVSFLIPEFYFLYRKCYGFAVLAITGFIAFYCLQLPMLNWMYNLPGYTQTMANNQLVQLMSENAATLSTTNFVLSNIGLGVFVLYRLLFGMFGNYILKSNCIKKINEFKADPNVVDYQETIALKGGVNFLAVMLGYIVLQFILIIVNQVIII